MNNYNNLIGTMYYYNNNPYATIENIEKLNNNYYRVYLKRGNYIYKYIDLTLYEMNLLYEDYLVRYERMNILKEKEISKLVHFTKVDNLENILEYGIFSVELLNILSIGYIPSDNNRLDGKLEFISTSISFPNYKMFYKKRSDDYNTRWAVITIDPKVIIDKLDSEFYSTNAANGIYSINYSPNTNNELRNMFYEENRDSNIPSYYTTDPQAEILIRNNIKNNYFMSIETLEVIPKVKSLTLNSHIDYNPNSSLFSARCDYKRW